MVILHVALAALALLSLTPFIWLICASLKQQKDMFTSAFLPWHDLGSVTFSNFKVLFNVIPFARWLFNSLLLASTQTVLVVTLSSLGGFALAKYRFHGKGALMLLMLATMLLPYQVILPR
jgi:ABC-type glycerol-3-phosphate transport system permease component